MKSAIALGIFAALLSFTKFQHCRVAGWNQPDEYVHACYSDLPSLFDARGLNTHTWPYASSLNSVEYPPGTALVMWATSFLTGSGESSFLHYFDINALLIAILFILLVVILARMKPELWFLLPLSPAVIASLYINWDMWAVIGAVIAIYFFERQRLSLSALWLGISISTKFFPIVLLLPIVAIFIRRTQLQKAISFLSTVTGTWLLINLPFVISTPAGWYRFFSMNAAREADWGSPWLGLHIYGIRLPNVSVNSLLLFLIGALIYFIYLMRRPTTASLASSAFVIVAIFVTTSKVYSPQYVLWLTPLAILALVSQQQRSAFWIWQGAEMIYHLAIWQHLALFTGARYGLSAHWYGLSIFIRIAALTWFCFTLTRKSTVESSPQSPQFLSGAHSG